MNKHHLLPYFLTILIAYLPIPALAGQWGIQVFVTQHQHRADALSAELINAGHNASIFKKLQDNTLLYKIRIGKFTSKGQARQHLQSSGESIAGVTKNRDAFLVEYDNDDIATPRQVQPLHPIRKADDVIEKARSYSGCPYRWGGESRKGIDCSALMQKSFKHAGIHIPRNSRAQGNFWKGKDILNPEELHKGDLIFFDRRRGPEIDHVGLVVSSEHGSIKFIHAAGDNGLVKENYLNGKWRKQFKKGKRLFQTDEHVGAIIIKTREAETNKTPHAHNYPGKFDRKRPEGPDKFGPLGTGNNEKRDICETRLHISYQS
ncbi:MAG: hypothetical protein B6245_07560 [Desulfobacteraceae bacterium 4572_88]|nr:MAG: hypothetical protein B6245_07560 [Desulfobacteraceae bacterium 4572_88]